ncbi:MAG: hypothetical protein IT198_00790 [Acidimicrobiia bacterium]|nr:hypothetical protein [Acidimicrobiia bacterium]
MDRDRFRDEATSDEDYDELEAFADSPTDPAVIEGVVSELVDDEDVAVLMPTRSSRGDVMSTDVDGTDMEAIFEEENRELDDLEDEMSQGRSDPVDLVDLHRKHTGDR